MSKELFDAVQMLAQEKGIPEDYLYEKISAAIVVAAKHDYNGKDIVHCDIDPEKQRFKVYVTKNVVEEVEDPDTDLTLEEAQAIKGVRPHYRADCQACDPPGHSRGGAGQADGGVPEQESGADLCQGAAGRPGHRQCHLGDRQE